MGVVGSEKAATASACRTAAATTPATTPLSRRGGGAWLPRREKARSVYVYVCEWRPRGVVAVEIEAREVRAARDEPSQQRWRWWFEQKREREREGGRERC